MVEWLQDRDLIMRNAGRSLKRLVSGRKQILRSQKRWMNAECDTIIIIASGILRVFVG
jgi:hypothetical protein